MTQAARPGADGIAHVAQHLAAHRLIGDGNLILGMIWGGFGLLVAAAVVLTLMIPGLLLLRAEPKA